MSMSRFEGVLAPVITPFDASLLPDLPAYLDHCRWLSEQGAGLAVFGTNSEAASLSLAEKLNLLEQLLQAGIDPGLLMPGTGTTALPDTVELTAAATRIGCRGVLMLPPYYFKNVSDDGLFAYFSEVINRVADDRLQIYLYHIPQITQVPLSLALLEKLAAAYPNHIAGIKDSSGDPEFLRQLNGLELTDFRVFCGSESLLLENLRQGGAGCISATANINPAAIRALCQHWQDADADSRQQQLNGLRKLFQRLPMIPALKTAVGRYRSNPGWERLRPPLLGLTSEQRQELFAGLLDLDFRIPVDVT